MRVTAEKILGIMRGWIGMDRAKGTHAPIIDLYNGHKPLARGYAVKYTDKYCATTVSAAFIAEDAVDMLGGTECGCEEFIKIFRKKGIWQEDGNVTPTVGAIILYNWDDTTQPNDGTADHIGIVESVKDGMITVIEGNIGGKVGRRNIAVGSGVIRGYAFPDYADEVSDKTDSKKVGIAVRQISRNCTGASVTALQILLAGYGYDPNGIDGDFGPGCEKAVKAFQKDNGLEADGIVGQKTWEKLLGD